MKKLINSLLYFAPVNAFLPLVMIFVWRMVVSGFSIGDFINWTQESTKKFAILMFILFLFFNLTLKVQLKILEKLKEQYPWMLKVLKYSFIFVILFTASLVINYYFQYFQHLRDPQLTIKWIEENSTIYYTGVFYLFFIFLLTFAIIGNVFISSFMTGMVLLAIGFIHYNKLNLRIEPLYPVDYKQFSNVREVIPMISEYISLTQMLFISLFCIVILVAFTYLQKFKIALWMRVFSFAVALTMIYSYTYFPKTFMKSFVEANNIKIVKWNQIDNYQVNGFLFGFISNLQTDSLEKPDDYSIQRVVETAQKYVNSSKNIPNKFEQTPNIVFLMSEAFWDPTKLNLNFSGDPLTHIRRLMTEHSSGQVLSPVFGGATANVEFEALTGFSTSFLKSGSIPYQDFIGNKSFIPTIVSDLEGKGYNSLAIHPFNKVFYKRNIVYNTFGFDEFLDQETMVNQNRTPGGVISDESLTYEILDNIKKEDKPLFIHAVSMQNHMPYNPGAYEENKIKVSGLSPESTPTVEVFSEGIRRSDEALQLLVNELEQLKEPTIVVFWGDHLPILGQNQAIYKEANYGHEDENINEKMYSETPLLIYTNFDTDRLDTQSISPFYLAPIVYKLGGLDSPPFYHLLNQLREEFAALHKKLVFSSDQKFITELTKEQKQLLDDYRLLEYDLLMGKQYSLELLYPQNN